MNHEKIIKRENGSVKIDIYFYFNYDKPVYDVTVYTRVPRKKKWIDVRKQYENDYEYRCKNDKDRKAHADKVILENVTREEVNQAKLECWEKLKPETFKSLKRKPNAKQRQKR